MKMSKIVYRFKKMILNKVLFEIDSVYIFKQTSLDLNKSQYNLTIYYYVSTVFNRETINIINHFVSNHLDDEQNKKQWSSSNSNNVPKIVNNEQ